ncbi:hypothetical protein VHEMI07787 [[Torrubiella] hemipterigena]|uniref:DUF6604 domain-containing protein n=1 Tax=[Torrubiella] hemipterigena TaxID=1531966 RepID=A0A0A1TBE7_9HYPO|nr:hypothetical protein VHEMI07787 [[Torrubiella] hemipterigena]
MLPEGLNSRYKRYKADTQAVASWLVTTAEKCGYQLPTSEKATTSTKSTRLKGKARKMAREHKTATPENLSHPYLLYMDAFIPLARWIANCRKPRILVPATFAYHLQHAIADRKRFQKYYEKAEENTNDGHGHFISVLQSVRDILMSNLEPGVSFEKESNNEDLDIHLDCPGLENMFSQLQVEDTPDESMGRAADDVPSAPRRVEVVANPASDLLEEFTVQALFWLDIHRIRMRVRNIWQIYKAGACDLSAAAITTNTAIDFVRGLHEDFQRSSSADVNFERKICLACAMLRDQMEGEDYSGTDLEVPCVMSGWLIILLWTKDFKNDPKEFVPTVHPNHVGLFSTAKVNTKTMDDDVGLAFGLIPEYCVLLQKTSKVQAEHGLIAGLRGQMEQDRPLFWLAFAVQIFIDVRKVLQRDITRGFEDLCRGASSIRHSIKKVLDFERETNGTPITDPTDKPLGEVLEVMDRFTINDHVGRLRKEMQADPDADQHIEDFYLLRRDPIWCGLLLYNFRMIAQEGSFCRANSFLSILAVAHLYNAQKQVGLLDSEWTNMEHILAIHSKDLFVGNLPVLKESGKNLLLALGLSPSVYARGRRPGSDIRVKQPRKLQRVALLTWLFKARYCDNDERTGLEPGHVVEVMRKAAAGKVLNNRLSSQELRIEEVLFGLFAVLNAETSLITFDYFEMHMMCWQLLCWLHSDLGTRIADWSEDSNEKGARALPMLVQYLLSDVSAPEVSGINLIHSTKLVKKMLESVEEVLV